MLETLQNYRKVYQMLKDEESKDIYLKRLNYLVSSDDKYIHKIVGKYLPALPLLSGKGLADLPACLPKDRRIVLYGAGSLGAELLQYFIDDKRFIGFCSGTKSKQENGYLGYPVMSPEELIKRKNLTVVISVLTEQRYEIRAVLAAGGYPQELIFGVEPFRAVPDQNQYFGAEFIKWDPNEVFVDAGCCDLGSSITLKKYCKTLKKIYAFEPDPECYKRCLEKKEQSNFVEAEILPFGTWSEKTTLSFEVQGTGSSKVSQSKGINTISVPVMPIDDVIEDEDTVTFIKMDVEGSELESLKGAHKTIQRDKPTINLRIW